jgi:hypothetical protein
MRLGLVVALCAISAAIGAGIDHYWDDAVLYFQGTERRATYPGANARNPIRTKRLK